MDDAGLARVKADAALLNAALNTLKGIGKEKGGLLQARPEVTEGQLFDEGLRASGHGRRPGGQRPGKADLCHPERTGKLRHRRPP